jgi:TonB family protein
MNKVVGIVLLLLSLVSANEVVGQTTNTATIATIAEQMPEYPGGIDSLMKEIALKVVYPQQCSDSNIQGKVFIRFIVNENGITSNAEVIKSPHPLLSAAALAAVKTIGKFKPATDKGKAVKLWYSLPVSFKIKQVVPPAPPTTGELAKISDPALNNSLDKLVEGMDTVFKFTEHPPEFAGGDRELIRFLQRNINYPILERDNDIQGKVVTRFTVNEDGSVSDITVIQSVSPGLDREAVRVIGLFPKFKPGTQQGKPVKVYYNVPVIFKLTSGYAGEPSRADLYEYYPGGYEDFSKFIYENLVYPPKAITTNTEAVIFVICRLNKNFKLEPIQILNDLDSMFSPEIVRLISTIPSFSEKISPAYMNQELRIEIVFCLDKKYARRANGGPDATAANRLSSEGADFFNKGKYEKALEYFDAAIRYYSLHNEAFFNRGATRIKLNDAAGACDDFRRSYLLGSVDAMDAIKQTCK